MKYRVVFTRTSEKDIKSLPKTIQANSLRQIKKLEMRITPDGKRIKKIKGIKGSFYRLRIGDYRAVFTVEGDSVTILRIVNRKELDRVVSR